MLTESSANQAEATTAAQQTKAQDWLGRTRGNMMRSRSEASLQGQRRDVIVGVVAWLVAGTLDITAAVTYYPMTTGVRVVRLLQNIASGALGPRAFDGGLGTAALGLAFHYFIALVWTVVFYAAVRRFRHLLRNLLLTGAVYGVVVWAMMNLVVLPLSRVRRGPLHPLQTIVAAAFLVICIGLPLAGIVGRHERAKEH